MPQKKPPSEHYDIEVYPIKDEGLEDSLDAMQKTSKGKKIDRE